MIHSSHRERKAKATAEVLTMIADAYPPLAPPRPRPALETEEWLFESATEFIEAREKYYAERATQIKEKEPLISPLFGIASLPSAIAIS